MAEATSQEIEGALRVLSQLEADPHTHFAARLVEVARYIAGSDQNKRERDKLLQFCKWSATALKLLLDEVDLGAGHPEKYEADFQLLIDLGVAIARGDKRADDGPTA